MTLVACIDENGGMMFGGRRQSKDRLLRERLLSACVETVLWASPYTAAQFHNASAVSVLTSLSQIGTHDAYFIEDGKFPKTPADKIILYCWNRRYPADRHFPFHPLENGYILSSCVEFAGSSHDSITEYIFIKDGISC